MRISSEPRQSRPFWKFRFLHNPQEGTKLLVNLHPQSAIKATTSSSSCAGGGTRCKRENPGKTSQTRVISPMMRITLRTLPRMWINGNATQSMWRTTSKSLSTTKRQVSKSNSPTADALDIWGLGFFCMETQGIEVEDIWVGKVTPKPKMSTVESHRVLSDAGVVHRSKSAQWHSIRVQGFQETIAPNHDSSHDSCVRWG